MLKITRVILLVAVVFSVAACESKLTAEQKISQATSYLNEGDYRNAMLTLKQLIQEKPDDASLRISLAKVYLPIGNGPSAEKELRKAEKLGAKKGQYLSLLVKSLLLQGEVDKALTLAKPIDGENAHVNAEILAMRGEAYLAKNDAVEAAKEFGQAVDYDATDVAALLGLIKVSAIHNDFDKADKLLNSLIKMSPNNSEVWYIKGLLLSRQQKFPEAEASYQKVIDLLHEKQISRTGFAARVGLAQQQLKQRKYDEALRTVNALLTVQPKHPSPKYLRALIAFEKKDYKLAAEQLTDVVRLVPGFVPGRMLMGSAQYALGNYEQARINLQYVVNEAPTHIQARKMLASTFLKLQSPTNAMKVLGDTKSESDSQLLAMMGKAALYSGDLNKGVEYYKKAISVSPDEPSIRAELANLYLNKGLYKDAITELEKINGAGQGQAKKMIIYAYIRDQNFDAALKEAKALAEKYPNDASITSIFGAIELGRGDRNKARSYFKKSLAIDPKFIPAINSLARLDYEEGHLDTAESWFDKILQKQPDSLSAQLGMAQIEEKRGNSSKAVEWIEKAAKSNPKALTPIFILTNIYLKKKDYAKVESLLSEAEKQNPRNPQLALVKAKLLFSQGKTDEVVEIYNGLIKSQPKNLSLYLQLAGVFERSGKLQEARSILLKAKKQNLYAPKLVIALVKVETRLGDYKAALNYIGEQKKKKISMALWHGLEGDVYLVQKKYKQAEESYKAASRLNDDYIFASKMATARYAMGDHKGAKAYIRSWIDKHPKDMKGVLPLAQQFIRFGEYKDAIPLFEKINRQSPKNPFVLNNLAWLYSQVDDKRSVTTAEAAYRLAPESAAVVDTYGWILVNQQDIDRGIDLLRKASKLSSNNPEIQYHLADALVKKGGHLEEAKLLVKSLISGDKLSSHPGFQSLRKKLNLNP